ncbi:hypothetical protein [Dankookia sp. P2]|uniref:hypothetical protein n=1 Tax=Dankookia sp. P2 TaxID=3423955 RepID=UPI003D670EBA
MLALCAPSELADEIRSLIEEPGEAAIEEILDFVETARAESGGEAIAARIAARDGGVAVTVLTEAGRVLDSRVFGDEEEEPLDIVAVRDALEGRVAILEA